MLTIPILRPVTLRLRAAMILSTKNAFKEIFNTQGSLSSTQMIINFQRREIKRYKKEVNIV